jgi:phenylacetate-CoA ligase
MNKQLGSNFKKIQKELKNNQKLNNRELKSKQEEKLNNLISYACNNNQFYKNYEINNKLKARKKIQDFPVIEKEQVRKIPLTFNPNKIFNHITSGSSGNPLTVKTDCFSESHRRANYIRFLSWHGLKTYQKNVLIWGQIKGESKKQSITKKIKKTIFPTTYNVNVFELNEKINKIYTDIKKYKPVYIRGYKSGILHFCKLIDEKGLSGSQLGLKKAITTSEILLPEERDYIEHILDLEVIDEYGAAEVGLIAVECKYKRKHILSDQIYFFTNDKQEIFVTDLNNYLMPLINYNLGDKLVMDEEQNCPCGLNMPIIKYIEGRQGDQIIKPNGEEISQYVIYYAAKELDMKGMNNSIKQYKVIQKDKYSYHFYFIKGKQFHKNSLTYIENRMKEEIDPEIQIKFEQVESIPKDKNGKIRFFVGLNQ